jgi:nitrite reductase/ring-hydroxylating ferredoxin subunit
MFCYDFVSMQPANIRFIAGGVEELAPGRSATVELPDGRVLALHNVGGEFYATANACPHQGAPLAEGYLCGHIVECILHGWQFDVRTGSSLTVTDSIETYPVVIEDGLIKIEI